MRTSALALAAAALVAGCSSPTPAAAPDLAAVSDRVEQIQQSVDAWREASTLDEAQQAADQARALITGSDVTGLEPVAADDIDDGLLPAEDGSPGLASAIESCAGADLLGGAWDDAAERWTILRTAIDEWAPDNITFPSLPSHAQRVVGWASLTLAATSLDEAVEYSGHAQLHVDASRDALASCR